MQLSSDIIERASKFTGDGRHLEAALGAYVLGELYGWRVVYLCHTQETLRKYEAILGQPISDLCPERTPLSTKSIGLRIVDAGTGFWAVIKGSRYRKDRSILESAGSLL